VLIFFRKTQRWGKGHSLRKNSPYFLTGAKLGWQKDERLYFSGMAGQWLANLISRG